MKKVYVNLTTIFKKVTQVSWWAPNERVMPTNIFICWVSAHSDGVFFKYNVEFLLCFMMPTN